MIAAIIFTLPTGIKVKEKRADSFPVSERELTGTRRLYNRIKPTGITERGSQRFPKARKMAVTSEENSLIVHDDVRAQMRFESHKENRTVLAIDSPNEALLLVSGHDDIHLNQQFNTAKIPIGKEVIEVRYQREHKERK